MNEINPVFDEMRETMHRQMLSSVSHDLKTPLATMIGSLEIFQRMYDRLSEEKRKTLVASALLEAYRLNSFISNILDMAKLENGTVKPQTTVCDLQSIVNDEIVRIGPKKEAGRFHVSEDLKKFTLRTDPALVGRIVGILIDNALKHAGRQPQIWITAHKNQNSIVLIVSDDGPGVTKGKEEEIFSKYTRLSHSDQQNAGTGLGLAIARAIAAVIGGTLVCKNTDSGASAFQLDLPLQ